MFIFLLPAVACINIYCLFYLPSILWYLYIAFVCYSVFFMDIQQKGGFPVEPIRHLFFWRWFCEFFPITTHKTAELDSKEKFIQVAKHIAARAAGQTMEISYELR